MQDAMALANEARLAAVSQLETLKTQVSLGVSVLHGA